MAPTGVSPCVCVCVCMSEYIYIYIYICICKYACVCVCLLHIIMRERRFVVSVITVIIRTELKS